MSGSLLRRGARRLRGILDPETAANPMVAAHNTTPEALAAMDRGGGVAVAPSIGVSRASEPLSSFGDVSLIAPPEMIDPRRVPVYGRDVYSPRYPRVRVDADAQTRALAARVGQGLWDESAISRLPMRGPNDSPHSYAQDFRGRLIGALDATGDTRDLMESAILRERWLREQGFDVDRVLAAHVAGNPGFTQHSAVRAVNDIFAQLPTAEQAAFTTYARALPEQRGLRYRERVDVPTNADGDSALRPHTPQNALRAMQNEARFSHPMAGQDWRGGEQMITDNWLLAGLTPQFRNMEELRGARGLLVGRDDPAHGEWTRGTQGLVNQIDNEAPHGVSLDSTYRNLSDAAREAGVHRMPVGGAARADGPEWQRLNDSLRRMNDDYWGSATDHYLRQDIALHLDEGRRLPTNYFEAKPRRNVPLSEFAGAVMPEDQLARVAPLLERQGITNFQTYPRGSYGSRHSSPERAAAFERFSDQFFSPTPLALTGAGVAAAARGASLLPPDEEPLL